MSEKKNQAIDKRVLQTLQDTLSDGYLVCNITPAHIETVLDQWQSISKATIHKRFRHLRTAFYYAVKHRYIQENPVVLCDVDEAPVQIREIPRDAVQRILEQSYWDWFGWYNRAALYQGFRLSEIRGLRIEDIHTDKDYVTVTGKHSKQRNVPLLQPFKWLLRTLQPDNGYLFPQYNIQTTSHRFKDLVRSLFGEYALYRFHDLRHTFATNYLREGGKLEALCKILGHTSLTTTLKYEHLLTEDLQEVPVDYGLQDLGQDF